MSYGCTNEKHDYGGDPIKLIAFYLPQFYPTEINNKWYGEGFTEWTNVAKAKPLFRGHYEPHIPADLGFYDLRLAETRRAQAAMAQSYGLSAFCYWNYWFGGKRQLLDMPIWEVYKDKQITFPFCLAWANHDWEKKLWDKQSKNQIIAKQQYLGENDYRDYFYTMLPLFKDPRYYRVDGKLFFVVYNPLGSEQVPKFIDLWRRLAKEECLGDFYFVGRAEAGNRNKEKVLQVGVDALYDDNIFKLYHSLSFPKKAVLKIRRAVFKRPTVINYKDTVPYMVCADAKDRNVIPAIYPNWDHSPRSGGNAIILRDCQPRHFTEALRIAKRAVANKPEEEQTVLIKAWNEWGEGNHLEPDLKYGRGYLEAIRSVLDES